MKKVGFILWYNIGLYHHLQVQKGEKTSLSNFSGCSFTESSVFCQNGGLLNFDSFWKHISLFFLEDIGKEQYKWLLSWYLLWKEFLYFLNVVPVVTYISLSGSAKHTEIFALELTLLLCMYSPKGRRNFLQLLGDTNDQSLESYNLALA